MPGSALPSSALEAPGPALSSPAQEPPVPALPGSAQEPPVLALPGSAQEPPVPALPGSAQESPVLALPGSAQEPPVPALPGSAQEPPVPALTNSLSSDNLQAILIDIQSKMLSIVATKIDDIVVGNTVISTQYKKEQVQGNLQETYNGSRFVNQQSVNTTIRGSDHRIIQANYRSTRYGNRVKYTTSNLQLCLGLSEARRIGIIGILAPLKTTMVLGMAIKITGIAVSAYVFDLFRASNYTGLFGIVMERTKTQIASSSNSISESTVSQKKWGKRVGLLQTPSGTKIILNT